MGDIEALASQINAMRPSERLTLSRYELQDLPGTLHETGWERLLGKIVGSSHADIWQFADDPMTQARTIIRLQEPAHDRR